MHLDREVTGVVGPVTVRDRVRDQLGHYLGARPRGQELLRDAAGELACVADDPARPTVADEHAHAGNVPPRLQSEGDEPGDGGRGVLVDHDCRAGVEQEALIGSPHVHEVVLAAPRKRAKRIDGGGIEIVEARARDGVEFTTHAPHRRDVPKLERDREALDQRDCAHVDHGARRAAFELSNCSCLGSGHVCVAAADQGDQDAAVRHGDQLGGRVGKLSIGTGMAEHRRPPVDDFSGHVAQHGGEMIAERREIQVRHEMLRVVDMTCARHDMAAFQPVFDAVRNMAVRCGRRTDAVSPRESV